MTPRVGSSDTNDCPRRPTPWNAELAARPMEENRFVIVAWNRGPFTALFALSSASAMESMGADPFAMAVNRPPTIPPRSIVMSLRVPNAFAAARMDSSIFPDAAALDAHCSNEAARLLAHKAMLGRNFAPTSPIVRMPLVNEAAPVEPIARA